MEPLASIMPKYTQKIRALQDRQGNPKTVRNEKKDIRRQMIDIYKSAFVWDGVN